VYFEYQVDRAVRELEPVTKAVYPPTLRRKQIEGEVQVEFIVDTLGAPELASFKVLKSPDPLFATSVQRSLPSRRFLPALRQGRKVRQVVRERIMFERNM
jgi:TonB family protein